MSATETFPPPIPLSQKPTRIIKARPPNRPPPHLPPKPPQKLPPCPQMAPVALAPHSGSEFPDSFTAGQPTSSVNVRRIAGLFQREPGGGAADIPPRLSDEGPAPEQMKDPGKVRAERKPERTCPPPLPPKLCQDSEERPDKMSSPSPHPACTKRCPCACHQSKPGLVLVWLPESSFPLDNHINETSDSSDDGGVFPVNHDIANRKWGPGLLRNKRAVGASYPARQRSLGSGGGVQEGVGESSRGDTIRSGVVLTAYKSMGDRSFNGYVAEPAPGVLMDGAPLSGRARGNGDVDLAPEVPWSEATSPNSTMPKDVPVPEVSQSETLSTTLPIRDSWFNRDLHSAPNLYQSEASPQRNLLLKSDSDPEVPPTSLTSNKDVADQVPQPGALPLRTSTLNDFIKTTPEFPNTEALPPRDSRENKPVESCSRVPKPARRCKVLFQAASGSGDSPPAVPPKVPSKPPRWAAPPPPPFLRKGSLKRYSVGSAEGEAIRDKKGSSSSLPADLEYRAANGDADNMEDSSQESCGGRLLTRPLPIKTLKPTDWESHLRDEPLYQTYRQTVICKEIRRQTVNRNSSFTSNDSSQDSPLSSVGSPRQGRRSTAPHNTLWQELPAVRESGMLESMSNEQRKMQEVSVPLPPTPRRVTQ
ncbi:uncharacterized protein LOC142483886 [Ascaphus truei]|uniref:uncharacterized protein LOC142483886 n=1 Tax=Ascaphus truei TaxID=8439 RepID=UPI003F591DAF